MRLLGVAVLLLVMPVAGVAPAAEKPLVVFVGDSITAGRPTGNPDYKPPDPPPAAHLAAGSYGYFEALVEATRAADVPFRFAKLGNGGQAITGWIGMTCRQVLEKRNAGVKELPAILIVQDFLRTPDEAARAKLTEALRAMAELSKKQGVQLVWIAATIEKLPGATWAGGIEKEHIDATNEVMLTLGKELGVPVIRMDTAWERWREWTKDKEPAAKWRLTQRGKIFDGVHPGLTGSLFFALVIARELGIPAEQFDEAAPALGLDKAQAAEIKKFVYGWPEPPLLPQRKKDE